jgi:hydroxymethylglutaryl-CoA synthase
MKVGIESIGFYTPRYFLDLKTLADVRNVDVNKYYQGIGQEKMSVPPPDEDIITMAANAAQQVLKPSDKDNIKTLMLATESGVDQSKAGGIWVHHLLELPAHCRVFELKQACYSGTAGLQMAMAMLRQEPEHKILLIMTDIARYGLNTPGEITQGAGAVAMVLSVDPKIISFNKQSGVYTEDVMDFWRPNYLNEALVDGPASVRIYLRALSESWYEFHSKSKLNFDDFAGFCYHLPFTKMGEKAQIHLAKSSGFKDCSRKNLLEQIQPGLAYNRIIGNVYTASLYLSLISLLEKSNNDLSGEHIGFFSYGSGCVGEFFSGQLSDVYHQQLDKNLHEQLLNNRTEIDYEQYRSFYTYPYPTDASDHVIARNNIGNFRLSRIKNHKRIYENVK